MFAQVVPPLNSTPMQLRLIKKRRKKNNSEIEVSQRAHLSLEPEILQLMIVVMLGGPADLLK